MTYDNLDLEGRRAYAIALRDKAIARRDAAAAAERALAEIAPGPRYGGSNAHRGSNKIHAMFRGHARRRLKADAAVTYWEEIVASCDRRIAERDRVRLTRDHIVGARFVRTNSGWHEVVRVNAKSVTVRTEVATMLYAFDAIHEVRGLDIHRADAERIPLHRTRAPSETGITVELPVDLDNADTAAAILRMHGWQRDGDEWTFPRPIGEAERLTASLDALAAIGLEPARHTQVNGFDADSDDLRRLAECGYDFDLWSAAMWHKQHRTDPDYRSRVQRPGQIWPGDTVHETATGARGVYTGRKQRQTGPLDIEFTCLVIDFGDEVRAIPLVGLEPAPHELQSP